jgi:alanine-glyoxylate transaminase/serine-glyoxylate transaminase/serine-pyruvate transaminase
VLRALSRPTIDHRGTEFAALTAKVLAQLKRVFQTGGPVIVYPSSGVPAKPGGVTEALAVLARR